MSGQTLTHCGKYLDQNQEADFHLELVQSAKWRSEKGKKGKRGQIKREKNCIVSTNTENERSMKKHLQGWMGMKKACNPTDTKQKEKKIAYISSLVSLTKVNENVFTVTQNTRNK